MDANAAGSAKEKVEFKLVRVQNALADKRVSLLLELETCKDEVFAIRAKALKEKKALEEACEEGFNVIFNHGYGCCAFTHNICGSQPEVPDMMPDTSKPLSPEFFINPRCPSGVIPTEATFIDVRSSEAANAPERETPTAVPEMKNSEASEHLSVAEVRPGNEADFSA